MENYHEFEPDELLALANLHFEKQDYLVALPILKKLVNSETAPVGAFSTLGRIYSLLGLYGRALAAFEAYLGFRPEAVPERFEKALVLRQIVHVKSWVLKLSSLTLRRVRGVLSAPSIPSRTVLYRNYG